MQYSSCLRFVYLSAVCVSIVWASNAWASAHTYDVNEVFSNKDGTIQFVELLEVAGANGQNFFTNRALRSNGSILPITTNLPNSLTANTNVLFATASFAALTGAPTPDYTMPDGFINVLADTIKFCPNVACTVPFDSFTFAFLSTDGITSLERDGTNIVAAINSPTNFAGDSGSVDVSPPPGLPSLSKPGFVMLVLSILLISARNIRMPGFQQG